MHRTAGKEVTAKQDHRPGDPPTKLLAGVCFDHAGGRLRVLTAEATKSPECYVAGKGSGIGLFGEVIAGGADFGLEAVEGVASGGIGLARIVGRRLARAQEVTADRQGRPTNLPAESLMHPGPEDQGKPQLRETTNSFARKFDRPVIAQGLGQ